MNESALNTEIRLPRQVKERADRARAMSQTPNPDEPVPPAAPPAAAVEPSPTPAPAVDPRDNDPVYWKQRFKVTEGMWKRDKERFAGELSALQGNLQAANQRIRELESQGSSSGEVDLTTIFTAEQIETLGEDQAKVIASTVINEAKKAADERIRAEVEPIRKQQQSGAQRLAESRQDAFLEALTELKSNWAEVNADERWIDWLSQDDPDSGVWRQTIIDQAQARGDAARVAKMITAWESEMGLAVTPATPNHVPQGRAGSAGQTPHPGQAMAKGTPTPHEIRDYYKRRALGKVREDEAKEFDARIAAAQAAGLL